MKSFILLLVLLTLIGCNDQTERINEMQNRIDSLEAKLAASYKPGLDEFMNAIQVHHIKLWFAGKNKNWTLADYELQEIIETVEEIKIFAAEQEASRMIGTISPALAYLDSAIEKEDFEMFKESFITLTMTCNQCHRASNKEFNVIQIPEEQIFSNQDFKLR